MNKKPKFIKASNLPPRISILWPVVWWMVLDRFSAPGWVFGAVLAAVGMLYAGEVRRLFVGEAIDLFGDEHEGS